MKNNDNLLADFFAFAAIAFTEKEKAEKSQAEKDTTEKSCTEKQCKCTENHCKNQQDFHKELFDEIEKFRIYLAKEMTSLGEVDKFLCNIEKKLISASK